MNIKFNATIIFLLLSLYLVGQETNDNRFTIGLSYGQVFTNTQNSGIKPSLNYSVGINTSYQLLKEVGISTGIDLQTQNLNAIVFRLDNFNRTLSPFPIQDNLQIVKFPVLFNFNMNYLPDPKYKMDLVAGYAFGKLLFADRTETEYMLRDLIDELHFGIVGFEIKRKLKNQIGLTLGSHVEMTNIYDLKYGEIQNFKILLRISK